MNRRFFLKSAGIFGMNVIFPNLLYGNYAKEGMREIYFKIKEIFPESREQIMIDGKNQILYLIKERNDKFYLSNSYPVSTSKYGFGNDLKSNKTPTGLHKISFKIGDGAEIGTIFRKRRNTKRISNIMKSERQGLENITTRVMPLMGHEEKNKYTNLRGIYIHGTSEEGLIGKPQSHGCIRMRNEDIVKLYSSVNVGTPVYISERRVGKIVPRLCM
jgi:lipoprotein-anchoring transpeptidase ErfK/SrfK